MIPDPLNLLEPQEREPMRVDLHHHMVPDDYAKLLHEKGIRPGGIDLPSWSPAASRTVMGHHGIRTTILSVSTPGAWFGDATEARWWARRLNVTAAEVVGEDPERFGFFATLTLPDVDGAIAEAKHALDELGADGIVLLANSAGLYLGDPSFSPLMEVLNERKAVVFVHPGELPAPPVPGVPSFAADFLLDTTRTALSLIMSGTMDRCPNIRFVLAHAGGFLPYIAERAVLAMVHEANPLEQAELLLAPQHSSRHLLEKIRRFWFDVALSSTPLTYPTLLAVADPDRIVYGSDFPFAPGPAVRFMREEHERASLVPEQRRLIDRGNAEKLIPRLARRA